MTEADSAKGWGMASPDALSMERAGSDARLNPMFGEWQHAFPFAPVPYGDGGAKRAAFRSAIQAQLQNRWIYSHEIQLEIMLNLDVQTVLETSETADLDNYAKAILDGLKGPQGIMFDDTQVQSLAISWLDTYDVPSFAVSVRAPPDDFLLKPSSSTKCQTACGIRRVVSYGVVAAGSR
jgi:hypothetical protein